MTLPTHKAPGQIAARLILTLALGLSGCAADPVASPLADRHITRDALPAEPPQAMTRPAAKPAPTSPRPPLPRYSLVAERQPVATLLFALAHDAGVQLDLHPGVEGEVTLNAIDQTLVQLLERISAQTPLRWAFRHGVLRIQPDTPFVHSYQLDYPNLSRDLKANVMLANSVSSTGSGQTPTKGNSGNSSATRIDSVSENRFWQRIQSNLERLLDAPASGGSPGGNLVLIQPESGTVSVRAPQRLQRNVAGYLAQVQAGARRQVMIEATIVEVALSDRYQGGVDWSRLAAGVDGLSLGSVVLPATLAQPPYSVLSYHDEGGLLGGTFDLTLRLLEQFGRTRVLSSPRIVALNNQAALMKVVEEQVYFTLDIDEDKNTDGEIVGRSYASTLHTVPVGLVLQVIPQISAPGEILLNIRPTVTRISGYVEDPAVGLIAATEKLPVKSLVPVLQVREFDSTLRSGDGQVTVLGGLIQDTQDTRRDGLPGTRSLGWLGELFGYRDNRVGKNELVVFLRPRVLGTGDVAADLAASRPLLPDEDFFRHADDDTLSAWQAGRTARVAP